MQFQFNLSLLCAVSFRVISFTSVIVLISNSSLTETRGTANGYGQALCTVGHGLGPVVGAPLFTRLGVKTQVRPTPTSSTQFSSYHDNND